MIKFYKHHQMMSILNHECLKNHYYFYHYQLQEPLILESGKEYKITIDLSTVQ